MGGLSGRDGEILGTRLKKTLTAAAVILLLACPQALAYEVSITGKVSKDEVRKGESFTYSLSVIEEGGPGKTTRLVPPDFSGFNVGSTSTQSSLRVVGGRERKVTDMVFRLSSDMPGEHVIGPAKLVLTDVRTGESQEMPSNEVRVAVLEQEQGVIGGIAGEIRDIKEPRTLLDTVKLYFYGLVAIALLALLILVGFAAYVTRKKTRKPAGSAPVTGPGHREAALSELERAARMKDDTRAFYTAVADAVRGYLSAAHGINAMEATTSELIQRAGRAAIARDNMEKLESLFTRADMVKFARHDPAQAEKDEFLRDALFLVKGL